MRIVFMGSADFGIPTLDGLAAAGHDVRGVVTTPPSPRGRGRRLSPSPVEEHARARGIGPVMTPENLSSSELVSQLAAIGADVFVVVAFRILPQTVFSLPRLGTLNVHASLLPRYRGPAPIQRAIEAGETETGVTVFLIDKGVDTGAIVGQRSTAIGADETTPHLYDRLAAMGAELLVDTVARLQKGGVDSQPQDHTRACPAPKLSKQEGLIDWSLPAQTIFNRIRAFKPFPGTYTHLDGEQLGIEWARPLDSRSDRPPGSVCGIGSQGIEVQCGDSVLRLEQVKPSGGKIMDAAAFSRGRRIAEGRILG